MDDFTTRMSARRERTADPAGPCLRTNRGATVAGWSVALTLTLSITACDDDQPGGNTALTGALPYYGATSEAGTLLPTAEGGTPGGGDAMVTGSSPATNGAETGTPGIIGGYTGSDGGTATDANTAPSDAGGPTVLDGPAPVPSAGCGNGSPPGDGTFTLDVDGTTREYIVEQPDGYDPNHPYRLIFTFHYLGGSASGIASGFGGSSFYGIESRAGGSAIFVSPEGINAGWANTGGRDVAFTTAMLDWLEENYCVDKARIFSTGFSYGGIMSNTVGCSLGDRFRAIAPIAGSGPISYFSASCKGQVAAWLAHGTSDTTVSFSSGQSSRDHWVEANGCSDTFTDLGDCIAYDGCDAGYPVHWCEFAGGHTRPSFAPDDIWEFFSQF